jgi:cell filamentation protein, protein adenylyltransferase
MAASSTRAGRYVRQPEGFDAFVPAPYPPSDIQLDNRMLELLSRADRELGRLVGAAQILPNPDLFLLMYVRREAVLSSQIEGTQASLMDILEYEAARTASERRVDVHEVSNYVAALRQGLRRVKELPLSLRLIKEIHERLMRSVRGGEPTKTPGEFRRSQNWVGGASPATARYVPPPVYEMGQALDAFEKALHAQGGYPLLVRVGLAHAQFETIHPFQDGNGRIGRLL